MSFLEDLKRATFKKEVSRHITAKKRSKKHRAREKQRKKDEAALREQPALRTW